LDLFVGLGAEVLGVERIGHTVLLDALG